MAAIYSKSISIGSDPVLTALVTTLGTFAVGPVTLDISNPTLEADVVAALNAADPMFAGLFSADASGETITISTICTPLLLISLTVAAAAEEFELTACDPVIDMELLIDCDAECLLLFTDKTKQYDPVTNPTGYGGNNWPAISDIVSVNFTIMDDGDDYHFVNAPYLPNAAGTSTICLKESDFDGLNLVPGNTYQLIYTLNLVGDEQLQTEPQDFLMPCCGGAVASNLLTNWEVTEKVGRTSMDFKDTTGTYEEDDNPGGYGAPNPAYGDIASTLIKITLQDGTVINITDFIPTADNQIRNITNVELGYGDGKIPPQIITVEYSVYLAGECRVGYKKEMVLVHGALRDCLVSKGKSIVVQACKTSCNKSEQKIIISLIHRYEMLLLASYGNIGCVSGELEDLWNECLKYCSDCQ